MLYSQTLTPFPLSPEKLRPEDVLTLTGHCGLARAAARQRAPFLGRAVRISWDAVGLCNPMESRIGTSGWRACVAYQHAFALRVRADFGKLRSTGRTGSSPLSMPAMEPAICGSSPGLIRRAFT